MPHLGVGSSARLANHVTEHPPDPAQRPLAQQLAARLRELRARSGLTQDQVAKQLSCHESAVSRWESGTRFPTGEDLVALSDLFSVSVDYLLGKAHQYAAPGTALLDQVLLVLILVEIVHTVVLSLRAHRLAAQPFIIVGLVAVIRRILFVLSSEVRVDTTELGLLILMLIAFVASFLAVSWFERRED